MAEELYTDTADEAKTVAPKSVDDLATMKAVKSTEASESYANFMNKHLAHVEGYEPITAEQAWTLIYIHRVWQGSEERAAEKAAVVEAKAAEKAQKAEEREAKKQEREAERARKAEEKAKRDAEKAAKKAAEADSDDDLDSVDEEGTGEIKTTGRKRRKRPAAEAPAEDAPTEGEGEIEGF